MRSFEPTSKGSNPKDVARRLFARLDRARSTASTRRIQALIGVGMSASIVVVIAWLIVRDRQLLTAYLTQANFRWLAVAFGFHVLAMLNSAGCWHLVVRRLALSAGYLDDLHRFAASLAAARLPGGPWGYVSRVYLYRQSNGSVGSATMALAVDQLYIGLAGLALLPAGIAYQRAGSSTWLDWALAVAALLLAIGLAQPETMHFFGVLSARVFRRKGDVGALAHLPRALSIILIPLYCAGWLLGGLILWSILRMLIALPLSVVPRVEGAWIISRLVALAMAPLPFGLGITEASLVALLTGVVPVSLAVVSAILVRVMSTFGEVAWYVLLSVALGRWRNSDQLEPPQPG